MSVTAATAATAAGNSGFWSSGGAALISGLGSIGSSLLGNSSAKKAAKRQYRYQLALQNDAQDFAKWQMENAHQLEVKDLEEAGLNKILSAGGSGASAGVSAGSAAMANTKGPELDTAIKNAIEMKTAKAQIKNIEQETETSKAQEELYKSESNLNKQTEEINKPDEETSKALKWWNSTWIGKGINVAGDVIKKISPFTDNYATATNANSAKRISKSKKYK